MAMNLLKIAVPLLALVAFVSAGYTYGFAGVAGVAGVGVFWILLHFSRMMQVLKRATNRPIGYVDSAVMLNAKLRPGVPLIHVIALPPHAAGGRRHQVEQRSGQRRLAAA